MYTTLNAIREHHPCKDGWEKLLKHLGKTQPDDEHLPLLTILESNGFVDTLWCFHAVEGFKKEKLLIGITYAKEVEHLMPVESKKALDVFERYANGSATQEEFDAARDAARAAARRADARAAARAAANDAFWAAAAACAARAAADAAADAADDADAAWAAARAAACAAAAADDAFYDAAYSTTKAKQGTQLRQFLMKGFI